MFMDGVFCWALTGCGSIANTHAKAIRSFGDSARLAAVCDIDPDRAAAFATEHHSTARDWNNILADPAIHAVTICTPSGLHADCAVAALRAGKHVLIEKPMDVTTDACDRIIAAQKQSGLQAAVVSQHRFDPAARDIRKCMESGELGDLFGVEARIPWYRTQEYYDSADWRGTRALDGGGCLINQGIHTLDLMLWFAGPASRVWARATNAIHQRIEVEDHICATIEFHNGAIGTLMASTAMFPGHPAFLSLACRNGTAILEGDELHTLAIKDRDIIRGRAHPDAQRVASGGTRAAVSETSDAGLGHSWVWGDAHRTQMAEFMDCCRHGGTPLVDARAGRQAVALIQALYSSARDHRLVDLA